MAKPPPAQRHRPVLRDRVVELLEPALAEPGSVCVDGTLGMGGHAEGILERCPEARLVGIDRDQQALDLAGQRLAPYADRLTLVHAVYDEFAAVVSSLGLEDRRRRALRPRRLVAAARRGGPRLRLPRRRAPRHAHGPGGRPHRGRGPQHLRRRRPDPDPAGVRRGTVRPPDRPRRRPGPRHRTVHDLRSARRAAPLGRPRRLAAQRRAPGQADLPGPAHRGQPRAGRLGVRTARGDRRAGRGRAGSPC